MLFWKTCGKMFTETLFLIGPNQKLLKQNCQECNSQNKRGTFTIKYYTTMWMNDLQWHSTTWKNSMNKFLSKRNQARESMNVPFNSICLKFSNRQGWCALGRGASGRDVKASEEQRGCVGVSASCTDVFRWGKTIALLMRALLCMTILFVSQGCIVF